MTNVDLAKYGFITYGTIKEEEEMKTFQGNKHPHKVNNSVVAEGKEYRLAVFYKESPIVIACNNVDFQQEFEESPGFVYWLTDWIEW